MATDLRPLQRALSALRFTVPLEEGDANYVEREDGLGQQILDRIMIPSTHRLLLAGPAGCGKSTELLQLHRLAHPNYSVFNCPCDRDLDLFRFDPSLLVRYLIWRMVFVVEAELAEQVKLTSEIRKDALRCLGGIADFDIHNPRLFFSALQDDTQRTSLASQPLIYATFSRLVSEIERAFLPALLLIDGLEKMPPTLPADTLGSFLRAPLLDECQSVTVVPSWVVYGWGSMEQYADTEVLRVSVPQDPTFVRGVVERRASRVFEPDALDDIAAYSGGVVRDGLQIAGIACRVAMSERSGASVTKAHVRQGRDALAQSFESMISDDPAAVKSFLSHVEQQGTLPGSPELRNRLLGNGIVLPNADGTFRVHPCARW